MRRIVSLVLSLCIILSAFTLLASVNFVSAETEKLCQVGGNTLKYTITGDVATIKGYQGTVGAKLTIPGSIDQKPVKEIGANAFENCTAITQVEFTLDNVNEYIPDAGDNDDGYFPGYWNMPTSVSNVETIGAAAFKGCTALATIEIPITVKTIGAGAFANSGIKAITYDSSITDWNAISKTESEFTAIDITFGVKIANTNTPAAPTLSGQVTADTITLVKVDGCEYKIGDSAWTTNNVFTGLSPATTYSFYQRYAETNAYLASESSVAAEFKTDKGTQEKAAAPIIESTTNNSVTLAAVVGAEYSKDGQTWQTSNVFGNLEANTQYTFYQRYAETETLYVGPISDGKSATTNKALGAKAPQPAFSSKTDISVTLVVVEGCEYSKDGQTWQDSNVFTDLSPATAYTFYQRYKETETHFVGDISDVLNVTTNKSAQIKAEAPTLDGKNETSVTLVYIDGYEYSKDGIVWQSSNVFIGLEPSTQYTFYQRIAETATTEAGEASDGLPVTTDAGLTGLKYDEDSQEYHYYVNGERSYASGFVTMPNGTTYYLNNGVRQNTTGIIEGYYVENGEVKVFTGLKEYAGVTYYFVDGIRQNTTGLLEYNNGYYYLLDGIWQNTFTGFVELDKVYYIKDGIKNHDECTHRYDNNCDTTCNVCDDTRTINHAYNSGVVTKKATCTQTGVKTYTCTVSGCGATRTEVIGKVAHTYKDYLTKATTSKNGKIVRKCSVCGAHNKTTTIYYAKTVKLSATSYTYNGKTKTPTVTVKGSNGKTISKSYYTVKYASGRKNVGKYKVTITFKGNYSGTKTLYFTINPVKTSVTKLTAAKKALTVSISKKTKQVTGYEIQYATNKKFSKAKKTTVKSYKTTKVTLKKLSAKKTYYVRVRTYKTVGKTKYYSGWSTVKYKKTK